MSPIKVLIADDDRALASALADTVTSAGDMEVVAVRHDADAAVNAAAIYRPDVILMDVRMPGGGGPSATKRVLTQQTGVAVVALSAHEDQATAAQMLEAGAVAYLVKGMPEEEIVDAIRRAKRGQMSLPADLGVSTLRDLMSRLRSNGELQDAEEMQRKSDQLFRGVLESAPDAMVAIDANGHINFANSRSEQLFGYSREELLAMSVDDLVPQALRAGHAAHRARYLRDPEARPMGQGLELLARRRDGSEFPVDISLSPMVTGDGTLVIAAVRDITDRRVAEKRLAETQEAADRRRLMAHLVAAQEEERRKIAADIHDDSIQAMTAASLRLQQLRKHITTEQQRELLARLDEAVRESITRLRRLMFDLRPPSLDRTGLGPALRELLDRLRSETDIEYTLDDRFTVEPAEDVRIELYRIAQEALANVRKHSRASHVQVSLQRMESGCHVRVADDGAGFEATARDGRPGHLGLVAMRERATIAGGWWTVDSRPGRGTVVDFWLPDMRDVEARAGGQTVNADRQPPVSPEAPR